MGKDSNYLPQQTPIRHFVKYSPLLVKKRSPVTCVCICICNIPDTGLTRLCYRVSSIRYISFVNDFFRPLKSVERHKKDNLNQRILHTELTKS